MKTKDKDESRTMCLPRYRDHLGLTGSMPHGVISAEEVCSDQDLIVTRRYGGVDARVLA